MKMHIDIPSPIDGEDWDEIVKTIKEHLEIPKDPEDICEGGVITNSEGIAIAVYSIIER